MRGIPKGFSLVEAVVAIVIMSIISVGLVRFITDSAEGYAVTAARNQLGSSGRALIDRLSMELHNALPQSVRIAPASPHPVTDSDAYAGDQCIEFIPVVAATTYIDPAIRPAARKTQFDVIDFVPEQDGATGVYVVIYPTSANDLYGASFSGNTTEAIAAASIADANNSDGINEVTTSTNHRFKRASSVDRLFLTSQPVSFCISGNRLYRYSGYGFSATQLLPVRPNGTCAAATCLPATTPDRVTISTQIANGNLTGGANGQAFDFLVASRRRNGVVQLELNIAENGEEIRLNHEVMQVDTP